MLYKVLTAPRIFGVSAARLSHRAHFDASEAEGWASGLVSAVRVVCVGFLLFFGQQQQQQPVLSFGCNLGVV